MSIDESLVYSQEELEQAYSVKQAFDAVVDDFTSDDYGMDLIADSCKAVEEWAHKPAEYPAKQIRKDTLLTMDIGNIVQNLFVEVLTSKSRLSLANISGILASKIHLDNSTEAIKLAAEIVVVIGLAGTGVYVLEREYVGGTYYVTRTVEMDAEQFLEYHSKMYMPPLIEKPALVTRNSDSPYVEHESGSLILKPRFNYHNENISLDVINRQNAIALCIDEEFRDLLEEVPSFLADHKKPPKDQEEFRQRKQQIKNWQMHLTLSEFTYDLMLTNGNKFYVPNKVDKRGRVYAQGHYINPMGTSYKKAIVSFHKQENINIPEGFFS